MRAKKTRYQPADTTSSRGTTKASAPTSAIGPSRASWVPTVTMSACDGAHGVLDHQERTLVPRRHQLIGKQQELFDRCYPNLQDGVADIVAQGHVQQK